MDSLDDVLQSQPVAEPETEQPQETTGEETAPPAETQPEQSKPVEEDREVAAFKAQAIDERRKRQALEQRLRDLEAKQQKPEVNEDDYWENPKKVIDSTKTELQQNFEGKLYQVTEELTRDAYKDYDEVIQYFMDEIAPSNPGIAETARSKANPHRFIYQEAKKMRKLAEIGDIDSYEEKIKQKAIQEYLDKQKADGLAQNKKTPPGSLANERAAGGNKHVNTSDSLEDILGR